MKRLEDMTEPEIAELMNALGRQVEAVCAVLEIGKPMFALLLFNDPRIAQYVCNCNREDTIKAMRECADRLESRQTVERIEYPEGLGATGQYPDGKLHGMDQGELTYAVGSDKRIDRVVVTFGKPVAWLGMGRKQALELSDALRWHASKIGDPNG